METVTVTRTVDAPPDAVAERLTDVEALMTAAGFDEVVVDDDRVRVVNHVGLATMELTVELVDADAALAYEQVDGIFDEMVTTYELAEADDGTAVTATTEFAVGARFVGDLLDATVISRQRRRELTAQLEYLDPAADDGMRTATTDGTTDDNETATAAAATDPTTDNDETAAATTDERTAATDATGGSGDD